MPVTAAATPKRPRSESGHTLVEISIASMLLVVILGIAQRALVTLHWTSESTNELVSSQSKRFDTLETVRREVLTASIDSILIEDGGRSIRFQQLLGAERVGGEVSGIWSSDVVLAFDNTTGLLVRRQDGATRIVASDLEDFVFALQDLRITLTCTVDGEVAETTVSPNN